MRRFILVVLALAGIGAALVVTASSTAQQANEAGMRSLPVQGALVVLLEVINVTGTWLWLTDTDVRVKVEAAVGVGLASIVTGTCGLLTYGPIGLVAPAGLLAAVHLLSRLLTPRPDRSGLHSEQAGKSGSDPSAAQSAPLPPTPDPVVDTGPPTEPFSVPTEDVQTVDAPDVAANLTDEAIVADLRSRPVLPGRDAVRKEFGVGTKRAERVIAEARKPALVKGGVAR